MPASRGRENPKYSTATGVVFLFNLIVGTGALALPGAFQKSGLITGILLLLILAFFSLLTVTFIVEALAAANALSRKRCGCGSPATEETEESVEEEPLVPRNQSPEDSDVFEITEKYEIGQMGVLMSPKWCQILIYLFLCIYLFGDVAIYQAVVGRTGAHVLCTFKGNGTDVDDISGVSPCWESYSISKKNVYRVSIVVFVLLLGPFIFFNLQKTVALQIVTVTMRWLAFFTMFIWCIFRLSTNGQQGYPALANLKSLPTLFGTLVYSFMCQHSVPGLFQPIANKSQITSLIAFDYCLVALFYILLNVTAVFSFKEIEDLYVINFWEITANETKFTIKKFLAYYLALFPIFTLSTSFPIVGITLRNNLRNLCIKNKPPVWYYDRLLFPLLAIVPSTILALSVADLHLLVGVTGSYAGAAVQYLIPCLLVHFARKAVKDIKGTNKYASPFVCTFWIYLVYLWMVVSVIFITYNYVRLLL